MSKKGQYSPYDDPRNRPSSQPAQASSDFARPAAAESAHPTPSVSVNHSEKTLPDNYVDLAESIITALKREADAKTRDQATNRIIQPITTTKLRNLLSLFSETYNECLRSDADLLSDAQISALRAARVRIIYECGRDKDVKHFIDKTQMLDFLFGIGNQKSEMIRYYHYLEALVAYGRFTGYNKEEK